MTSDLAQVKAIGQEAGVRFLALGFDPTTTGEDVPHVAYSTRPLLRTLLADKNEYWDAIDNSCSVQVHMLLNSWASKNSLT